MDSMYSVGSLRLTRRRKKVTFPGHAPHRVMHKIVCKQLTALHLNSLVLSASIVLVMYSAPVSYPMIYLTEILLYWQWCIIMGASTATVGSFFKTGGVTGHSQGVVCAVVVALAKSDVHFAETALKFLKYTFFHGLRVQQAYPAKTLPAKGRSQTSHTLCRMQAHLIPVAHPLSHVCVVVV